MMRTCYAIAQAYRGHHGSYDIEDLAQAGMASILTELRDHPKLRHGSKKWMGTQAKWAMANELRRERGRRGTTRQGKLRARRPGRMSLDAMTTEYAAPVEDIDLKLTVEQATDDLSDKLKDTTTLLRLGYTQTEIAGMLGVTPQAIYLRVQSIKEQWNEALA